MIAEQILDFQIFNDNHVIALNQLSRYFLQVVVSNVSDLKLVLAFGLSQLLPVGIVVLVYLASLWLWLNRATRFSIAVRLRSQWL